MGLAYSAPVPHVGWMDRIPDKFLEYAASDDNLSPVSHEVRASACLSEASGILEVSGFDLSARGPDRLPRALRFMARTASEGYSSAEERFLKRWDLIDELDRAACAWHFAVHGKQAEAMGALTFRLRYSLLSYWRWAMEVQAMREEVRVKAVAGTALVAFDHATHLSILASSAYRLQVHPATVKKETERLLQAEVRRVGRST